MPNGGMLEAEELGERLAVLAEEHRDLDATIAVLAVAPDYDQVKLERLKKRKLRLRDEIERLRDLLQPDIIA